MIGKIFVPKHASRLSFTELVLNDMASQVAVRKRFQDDPSVDTAAKHPAIDYDYTRCNGMRVFLDGECWHQGGHNEEWRKALEDGVEAGTLCSVDCIGYAVDVTWDCGAKCTYRGDKEFGKLRVLDCAATGTPFTTKKLRSRTAIFVSCMISE